MSTRKRWRGPRNKKVTSEMKDEMKKLRAEDWTYQAIADKHGLSYSTVHYHLNPRTRELAKLGMRRTHKKHGPSSKRYPQKTKEYMREYMRERYRKDPEFHARMDEHHMKYMKSVRAREREA